MTLPTSGYTFDHIDYNFYTEFGGFDPLNFKVTIPSQLGDGTLTETVIAIVEAGLSDLVDALSGISTGTPSISKVTWGQTEVDNILDTPS